MASLDRDASCVNDPNFAVVCAFLQKFGTMCGIEYPTFNNLQKHLENIDEVPTELSDLLVKLLRKNRYTVHAVIWERALVKFCYTYSKQDAWEVERFGYKKSRLPVKLNILKSLLESQFDKNGKFKNVVSTMKANEMRSQPIGRDTYGNAYWTVLDQKECNTMVYQEHLDEETWQLVASNRNELSKLIDGLKDNKRIMPALNIIDEDSSSNSLSDDKINSNDINTTKPKSEIGADIDKIEVVTKEETKPPEKEPDKIDETNKKENIVIRIQKPKPLDPIDKNIKKTNNGNDKATTEEDEEEEEEEAEEEEDEDDDDEEEDDDDDNEDSSEEEVAQINKLHTNLKPVPPGNPKATPNTEIVSTAEQQPTRPSLLASKPPSKKLTSPLTVRLGKRSLETNVETENKKLKPQRLTLLGPNHKNKQNEEESFDEEDDELGEEESEEESEEDGDDEEDMEEDGEVANEVSVAIEEPIMVVTGEGTGSDNKGSYPNFISVPPVIEFSNVIEEPVQFFLGEGCGVDCDVGNLGEQDNSDKQTTLLLGQPGCLNLNSITTENSSVNEENKTLSSVSNTDDISNKDDSINKIIPKLEDKPSFRSIKKIAISEHFKNETIKQKKLIETDKAGLPSSNVSAVAKNVELIIDKNSNVESKIENINTVKTDIASKSNIVSISNNKSTLSNMLESKPLKTNFIKVKEIDNAKPSTSKMHINQHISKVKHLKDTETISVSEVIKLMSKQSESDNIHLPSTSKDIPVPIKVENIKEEVIPPQADTVDGKQMAEEDNLNVSLHSIIVGCLKKKKELKYAKNASMLQLANKSIVEEYHKNRQCTSAEASTSNKPSRTVVTSPTSSEEGSSSNDSNISGGSSSSKPADVEFSIPTPIKESIKLKKHQISIKASPKSNTSIIKKLPQNEVSNIENDEEKRVKQQEPVKVSTESMNLIKKESVLSKSSEENDVTDLSLKVVPEINQTLDTYATQTKTMIEKTVSDIRSTTPIDRLIKPTDELLKDDSLSKSEKETVDNASESITHNLISSESKNELSTKKTTNSDLQVGDSHNVISIIPSDIKISNTSSMPSKTRDVAVISLKSTKLSVNELVISDKFRKHTESVHEVIIPSIVTKKKIAAISSKLNAGNFDKSKTNIADVKSTKPVTKEKANIFSTVHANSTVVEETKLVTKPQNVDKLVVTSTVVNDSSTAIKSKLELSVINLSTTEKNISSQYPQATDVVEPANHGNKKETTETKISKTESTNYTVDLVKSGTAQNRDSSEGIRNVIETNEKTPSPNSSKEDLKYDIPDPLTPQPTTTQQPPQILNPPSLENSSQQIIPSINANITAPNTTVPVSIIKTLTPIPTTSTFITKPLTPIIIPPSVICNENLATNPSTPTIPSPPTILSSTTIPLSSNATHPKIQNDNNEEKPSSDSPSLTKKPIDNKDGSIDLNIPQIQITEVEDVVVEELEVSKATVNHLMTPEILSETKDTENTESLLETIQKSAVKTILAKVTQFNESKLSRKRKLPNSNDYDSNLSNKKTRNIQTTKVEDQSKIDIDSGNNDLETVSLSKSVDNKFKEAEQVAKKEVGLKDKEMKNKEKENDTITVQDTEDIKTVKLIEIKNDEVNNDKKISATLTQEKFRYVATEDCKKLTSIEVNNDKTSETLVPEKIINDSTEDSKIMQSVEVNNDKKISETLAQKKIDSNENIKKVEEIIPTTIETSSEENGIKKTVDPSTATETKEVNLQSLSFDYDEKDSLTPIKLPNLKNSTKSTEVVNVTVFTDEMEVDDEKDPLATEDPLEDKLKLNIKGKPAKKNVSSPVVKKKRRMDVEPELIIKEENETPVRMSRRIAQLKIKEETERRKLEEMVLKQMKAESNKIKKEKGIIVKTESDPDAEIDEDEEDSESEKKLVKTKLKKKKKERTTGDPWLTTSGTSDSDEAEEEEDGLEREEDEELPPLKSDHEFSPESDMEDETQLVPTKRARTVKKEEIDELVEDPEHACQKCKKHDHPEWILLCDSCDKGYHCSCLSPVLFIIPEGDWFCPPCEHVKLIGSLNSHLEELDEMVKQKILEENRKRRQALASVSVDNVIASKTKKKYRSRSRSIKEASTEEESSSEEDSSSDDDEPIYKLRRRRQTPVSYIFNDYDDLINSAIKHEVDKSIVDSEKNAGNIGRGKDISTIIEADKEEKIRMKEQDQSNDKDDNEIKEKIVEENGDIKTESPIPKDTVENNDSDSEPIRRPVKRNGKSKKKSRKLNSLDIDSEDDASDEDFKGSSPETEEDEDYSLSSASESSLENTWSKKNKNKATRGRLRQRRKRKDEAFIDDNSDDSFKQKRVTRKKTKKKDESDFSDFDDEDDEEDVDSDDLCDSSTDSDSDGAWRPQKRNKKPVSKKPVTPVPKKVNVHKKKAKRVDENEKSFRAGVAMRNIITTKSDSDSGGAAGRKTRGKRTTYIEDFDSSDDGIRPGVKRPDTPPEERELFIKKQEEIKRMLAAKNTDAAKMMATPVLKPIKSKDDATPNLNSLSTVPRQIIQNAKVLDPDFLKNKNSESEAEFDEELPEDFDPEDMDEEEIAKMMEEEDFAQQQLKLAGEAIRNKKLKEAELNRKKDEERLKHLSSMEHQTILPPQSRPRPPPTKPNNLLPSLSGDNAKFKFGLESRKRGRKTKNDLQNVGGTEVANDGYNSSMAPNHPLSSGHRPSIQSGPLSLSRPHDHPMQHNLPDPTRTHTLSGPPMPHHLSGIQRPPHHLSGLPRPPHHLSGPPRPRMLSGPSGPHMLSGPPVSHNLPGPHNLSPHLGPPMQHNLSGPRPPPSLIRPPPVTRETINIFGTPGHSNIHNLSGPPNMTVQPHMIGPPGPAGPPGARPVIMQQPIHLPPHLTNLSQKYPNTSTQLNPVHHSSHRLTPPPNVAIPNSNEDPIIPTTVLSVQNQLVDHQMDSESGGSEPFKKRGRRKKITPLRDPTKPNPGLADLSQPNVAHSKAEHLIDKKTNPILAERLTSSPDQNKLSVAAPPQLFSRNNANASVITRLQQPPRTHPPVPYGQGPPRYYSTPLSRLPPHPSIRPPFPGNAAPSTSPVTDPSLPPEEHYINDPRQPSGNLFGYAAPTPIHHSLQVAKQPGEAIRSSASPRDFSVSHSPSFIPTSQYGEFYPSPQQAVPANPIERHPSPERAYEQFEPIKQTDSNSAPALFSSSPPPEETTGTSEFSGLVSYFSSQQDDLDT